MDAQLRNSLLLDSMARQELQRQEYEQALNDREKMIQQMRTELGALRQQVANQAGTPAESGDLEAVGSNGRDRLPG